METPGEPKLHRGCRLFSESRAANAPPNLFKLAYVNKIREILAFVPISIIDFDKRDTFYTEEIHWYFIRHFIRAA